MADKTDMPPPEPAPTLDMPAVETPGDDQPTMLKTPSALGSKRSRPISRMFGDYELLGEIGRGGMGVVYEGRERLSGRLVALKMMLGDSDETAIEFRRFSLEARATGELHHSGIVGIHAWGEHEGHPYYTMDYVPGVTLARLLQDGPLPLEQAVRYVIGIARAVGTAHAVNIIHRDLKPSNIIIDSSDQPRVLDFGLAKRHGQPSSAAAPKSSSTEIMEALPADASLSSVPLSASRMQARPTERGAILGTPAYMAPEQARGEHDKVGPPADVHALGAMLYEMLTGRPPFQAPSLKETLKLVEHVAPPPLREPGVWVPRTIEECCRRCLAKEPRQRYADATSLADDLEQRWHRASQGPWFARRTLVAALAFLVLIAIGLALGVLGIADAGTLASEAWSATESSGPTMQIAAVALAWIAAVVCFYLLPTEALGVVFIWYAAWMWHTNRSLLVWAASLGVALLSWVMWITVDFAPLSLTLLGAALALTAATVLGGLIGLLRLFRTVDTIEGDSGTMKSEPFLQRLFAGRVEPRSKGAGAASEGTPAGLADYELGKLMQDWPGGSVRWAKQKSLARPVLVWQESFAPGAVQTSPSAGEAATPLPGVVVRHPDVLALYSLGSGPQGWYLATEPVAAVPLAEVLSRQRLPPLDAVALTVKLARAVQAFHDQGAVHGRVRPEWILIRGDLDPVLCPCGVPSAFDEERREDVAALGRLLKELLPAKPGWFQRSLAAVYKVCDDAILGAYHRPADLAEGLEWAVRAARYRRRARWTNAGIIALVLLPLLGIAVDYLVPSFTSGEDSAFLTAFKAVFVFAPGILALAIPSLMLLGYAHARSLVLSLRLRARGIGRRPHRGLRVFKALAHLSLFALLLEVGLAHAYLRGTVAGTGPAVQFQLLVFLLGAWLVGMVLAGMVTAAAYLAWSLWYRGKVRSP